jgi:hypothetical protein
MRVDEKNLASAEKTIKAWNTRSNTHLLTKLRSDEMVEVVAWEIYVESTAGSLSSKNTWHEVSALERSGYVKKAKAALAAIVKELTEEKL